MNQERVERASPPISEFWRSTLDSMTAHVAVLDGDGRILAVNNAWRRFAKANGYTDPDACIGTNYLEVCGCAAGDNADEAAAVLSGIRSVLAGERRELVLPYPCHSPEKQRWFMLRVTRFDGSGPAKLVVAHDDITAAKAAQIRALGIAAQLEKANAILRGQKAGLERAEALEADCSRILELIARNELLNAVLREIALLVERQAVGHYCGVLVFRNGRLEIAAAPTMPLHARLELEIAASETLGVSTDNASLAAMASAITSFDAAVCRASTFRYFPISRDQSQVQGYLAVAVQDAATEALRPTLAERAAALAAVALDHAALYDRLSFQADHDALTGLPNRLLFQEHLQQTFVRARREGRTFAVLIVDLDRFKQLNDTHGHLVGDALLRLAGQRIQSCLRPQHRVARQGGDEFIILLDDLEAAHVAVTIASEVCAAFQESFLVGDLEIQLSCSVGVGIFPQDGADPAMLVRNAGAALSVSKNLGRNTWTQYDRASGLMILEREEIERHLREAAQAGQLDLVYQPQLDINGNVIGMEALMRWNSPVLGPVPPARFIPIAEQSGLIVSIGLWALRRACAQCVSWIRAGAPPARMSVNVSPLQLIRCDFAQSVAAVLRETGLHPDLLELEVTEGAMIRNMAEAIREMEKLRCMGVRISIDDFGTGYSSLSYVHNLPVDAIKIDRSFIQELDGASRSAESVVRAIVTLAHNLELEVVAEGVETAAQLESLFKLKCDFAQGYYLHRPLPAKAAERVLLGSSALMPIPESAPIAS